MLHLKIVKIIFIISPKKISILMESQVKRRRPQNISGASQ